jgi:hypothetical protein
MIKHKKSEACSKIHKLLIKKDELYKIELDKKEISYQINLNDKNNLLKDEQNKNIELQNKINELTQENIHLKNEIKVLEKSSENFRKIVEKAATKTTIKNNNNNYTHNNYLNYISSEPLKFKEIKEQAKKYINSVSVMYDDDDFHDHIVDNILKDKSGKDKVLCTDINRKNFTYKDEISGKMIYDPELERLREQLKKGADIKSVKRELLDKLIKQYDNTEIDPYVKFCDILKKLDFGNPFVDHVAKKTYIKTKSILNIE